MSNELNAIPIEFPGGTTVAYRKSFADHPASAGWAMSLFLAGASVLEVPAEADGDAFVTTITASLTSNPFVAGMYEWSEQVSKDGEVYQVASGKVTITPNLAEAAPGDRQSYLERSIPILEAHLEGRHAAGMDSYVVAGRQVNKIPMKEAQQLLTFYRSELARLSDPSRVTRSVLVSFTGTGANR